MFTLYPVVDPDLQITGGGGGGGGGRSSRPWDEEGGGLKIFFFGPSGLSLVQK